jgi:hypothetical protein
MIKFLLIITLFCLSLQLIVTAPRSLEGAYEFSIGLFGNPYIVSDCEPTLLSYYNPTDGCSTPLNQINGTVVLVDRGKCSLIQQAGGIGMIVVNNAEELHLMTSEGNINDIEIRAIMITRNEGNGFKKYIQENPSEPIRVKLCFPMSYSYFN